MEMELQRSVTSFRRQGSSGLVWDDKFLAGLKDQNQSQEEAKPNENQQEIEREQRQSQSVGSIPTLERSRSTGAKPYRTVNVAPPSGDPPSPKVATCGFCGFFGKPVANASTHKSNPKSKKRR